LIGATGGKNEKGIGEGGFMVGISVREAMCVVDCEGVLRLGCAFRSKYLRWKFYQWDVVSRKYFDIGEL
jgi:hypothetical protein